MKYYCECISVPLAEKLKEKGMPTPKQILCNFIPSYENEKEEYTFGFVFDWLMSEKGLRIVIEPSWDFANERITDMWDCDIVKVGAFSSQPKTTISQHDTWHEAAEKAIEKALTLI